MFDIDWDTIGAITLMIIFFLGVICFINDTLEYHSSEEYKEQKRIEQEKIDNCEHDFLMITRYDPITKYKIVHKCSKCGYEVK